MNIGQAIEAIKAGKFVRMPEWRSSRKFLRRGEHRGVNSIEWNNGVGFLCGPDLLLSERWEVCPGGKDAKDANNLPSRAAAGKSAPTAGPKPKPGRVPGRVSLLRRSV